MIAFLVVLGVAALAGLLFTSLVIRIAIAHGLYDVPTGGRRIHVRPVPRLGGVAVFLATGTGLVVALLLEFRGGLPDGDELRFYSGLFLGGAILFGTGLWDDLRGMRPLLKLAAQCLAAYVVFHFGFQVEALSVGPSAHLPLGWLALPMTILWVAGVSNAVNLIDGLDGLATGIALVALGTTLAVATVLERWEVVMVCAALVGALLGFLRYNFNPARIFLGDSGSLFVGFMLAVLSVHGSMKSATAVLVMVPLFALALPLLDTGLTLARRWLRGVPIAAADARHIHHQLVGLGLTHRRAVSILYVAATGLAMLGVSLAFAPPAIAMGIALVGGVLCLFLLLLGMRKLQYHEFAEAGAALVSALRSSRRAIRDRIHARDLTAVIVQAKQIEEIAAVVKDSAADFGFLHMELCRPSAPSSFVRNGSARRVWKLEYPVYPVEESEPEPYVLRVWSDATTGFRPQGAERVARILAPAIEEWMRQNELWRVGAVEPVVRHGGRLEQSGMVPEIVEVAR